MPFILLLAILVGVACVFVNVGSKDKVPVAKLALTMLVVCVAAYFLYPMVAPLVAQLMQMGQHFPNGTR